MVQGGLISIEESLHQLTPMERRVGEYILNHPKEVVKLSVQRLAELADVSEATIVRLSRSLHCRGFQDLKLRIAGDLAQSRASTESYQEIQLTGSTSDMLSSIVHNNIKSIQDTATVLAAESVEKAIHAIHNARKVGAFAIGASAVIAEDFKHKLSLIDRWCETAAGYESQITVAAHMHRGDVALGISYSGDSEDIIRSLQKAKENGAMIISLTKFGVNPVAEMADIRLFTSSLERSIRSGETASRIAQLTVIDMLFVGVAALSSEISMRALEKTRQAVSGNKRSK
jgi:DNA-binding MurR/RpiR family transcriptional regulator